jgi:hypothetical protein
MTRTVGSRVARLYGILKYHKSNVSFRQVMSTTKTLGYGLDKMLTNRLSALRQNSYAIKHSFDYVNKIQDSSNVDNRMLSFDVTRFFC